MSWAIRLGDDKNPMWLKSIDDDMARFSPDPRPFRSRSYAERLLKQARTIVGSDMTLVQL